MTAPEFAIWLRDSRRRPLVMGVLNVTPDSFSDGGQFASVEAAAEQARRMAADGADIIDIGGESTRPGAPRVSAERQIDRIIPVFRAIKGSLPCVLSVDTTLAEVAEAAMDHGAGMVNDISAGQESPLMLDRVARHGAAVVLMHMLGQPATMQQDPRYSDVVAEVTAFLADRLAAAIAAGVPRESVLLDPGIGFGKTADHNLVLLQKLGRFVDLNQPVVVGTSRKAFIGRITGESEPAQRDFGTAATVAWSVTNGASVVRVHDVGPMNKVVRVIRAIQAGRLA